MDCPATPHDDARHTSWRAFLDSLEADAGAGRELSRARAATETPRGEEPDVALAAGAPTDANDGGAPAAWTAPWDLGRLPSCLARRAREVLAAQSEAVTVLGAAILRARRHESALASVPSARSGAPVYVDVTG